MKLLARSISGLVLLLCFAISCTTPIDLNFGADNAKFVVDGYITDALKVHTISLSYSYGFDQDGLPEPAFITNAHATIEDEAGALVSLTHTENGQYITPMFAAVGGQGYRINVLVDGKEYTSDFAYLPKRGMSTVNFDFEPRTKPAVTNNNLVEENGIQVFTTIESNENKNYYKWVIEHWYVSDATFILYEKGPNATPPPMKFCYTRDFDYNYSRVNLLEDGLSVESQTGNYRVDIEFVRLSRITLHEMAFLITQLTLNEDAYAYWNLIKKQQDNSGSIFDVAPFSIVGNVYNTNDKQPALGYFGFRG